MQLSKLQAALDQEIQCQSLTLVNSHYFMADLGGITLFPVFSISDHVKLYKIILFIHNLNYFTLLLQHILSKFFVIYHLFHVALCTPFLKSVRLWKRREEDSTNLDQTNGNFTDHVSPVSCSFSIRDNTCISMPHFLKVGLMLLCFCERATLLPVFANQKKKKSKEDFHFYK